MSRVRSPEHRERSARLLGVAVALAAMTASAFAIGWPAPGVSAGLGLAVYALASRRLRGARDAA